MAHYKLSILSVSIVVFLSTTQAQSIHVEELATQWVKLLQQNNFSDAVDFLDREQLKSDSPKQLASFWSDLIHQAGAYQRQWHPVLHKRPPFSIVVIPCEFEKRMIEIKLVFDQNKKITGFWFLASEYDLHKNIAFPSPAYVNLDLFSEQELTIGQGKQALPATLSLPNGPGPFPIVILIHDRIFSDRDETIGPNKPFRDLAWGLASQNISVLRYEKRRQHDTSKKFTVDEEVVHDVLLAIDHCLNNRKIDSKSIFILGHGFGGMLVPRIIQRAPNLAGAIILAGHVTALEDVAIRVLTAQLSKDGILTESEKDQLASLQKKVNLVKDPRLEKKKSIGQLPYSLPLEYWLAIRQYHPGLVAQSLSQPMLILQGGKDFEVTLDDFRKWKKYLAHRNNVSYKLFIKLNHFFINTQNPSNSTPQEYHKPGHVDQQAVNSIANWINKYHKY